MSRNRPARQLQASNTSSPASRRLRQKTRLDYRESSDTDSPLLHQAQTVVSSQNSSHSSDSEYAVRAILQQRLNSDDEVEYLIDWADHPITGQQYTPSWEPYENLDPSLEADWLRQQHQRRHNTSSAASPTKSSSASQSLIPATKTASSLSLNSQIDDSENGSNQAAQSANDKWSNKLNKAHTRVRQRRVIESSPSTTSSPLDRNPPRSTRRRLQFNSLSTAESSSSQTGDSQKGENRLEADTWELDQSNSSGDLGAAQPALHFEKSSNSLVDNPSADYHPHSSSSTHLSSSEVSASTHTQQHSLQSVGDSSTSSTSGADGASPSASSASREEAELLVPRSSFNRFGASAHTPRRFSPTAVIPDSQGSAFSFSTSNSAVYKAGTSHQPSLWRNPNNQVSSIYLAHYTSNLGHNIFLEYVNVHFVSTFSLYHTGFNM
jgi:hypothetical protein